MANANCKITSTSLCPSMCNMWGRYSSRSHEALGLFSHVQFLPKKLILLLPRDYFPYSSKTLIPEMQIYQGSDNWGLTEVLMFQTEKKKTKWSEAALSNFLSSLILALILVPSLSSVSLLLFLPFFLSRDIKIKMYS